MGACGSTSSASPPPRNVQRGAATPAGRRRQQHQQLRNVPLSRADTARLNAMSPRHPSAPAAPEASLDSSGSATTFMGDPRSDVPDPSSPPRQLATQLPAAHSLWVCVSGTPGVVRFAPNVDSAVVASGIAYETVLVGTGEASGDWQEVRCGGGGGRGWVLTHDHANVYFIQETPAGAPAALPTPRPAPVGGGNGGQFGQSTMLALRAVGASPDAPPCPPDLGGRPPALPGTVVGGGVQAGRCRAATWVCVSAEPGVVRFEPCDGAAAVTEAVGYDAELLGTGRTAGAWREVHYEGGRGWILTERGDAIFFIHQALEGEEEVVGGGGGDIAAAAEPAVVPAATVGSPSVVSPATTAPGTPFGHNTMRVLRSSDAEASAPPLPPADAVSVDASAEYAA